MKPTSLWIIRLALTVQFLGVLAVPTIVASAESPRALWMAEWMNPPQEPALGEGRASSGPVRHVSNGRTIGVLKLRDSKLTFVEQIGQVDWELDLAHVKKVATVNGGRNLLIVSATGDEYVIKIMQASLESDSPKRALTTIERAIDVTMGGR
jgi:hypothetical protein